jgi:hypothetical protein
MVGIEIGIESKTLYENSVLPNNVLELARSFSCSTQLSTLKVNSGETSTG